MDPSTPSNALEHIPSIAYLPEYVSKDVEDRLLRECQASRATWTQLSGRRLQNHGGVVHAKGLIQTKMPTWLSPLLQQLACEHHPATPHNGAQAGLLFGDKPPNHVLVNSYQPGQGILPHADGPAYHPAVCILSLAAPAVIRFHRKPDSAGSALGRPAVSLLLMPRSLLVFADEAYTHCLHSIDEVCEEVLDSSLANLAHHPPLQHGDRVARVGERVSLTVRRVAKVLPNLIRL